MDLENLLLSNSLQNVWRIKNLWEQISDYEFVGFPSRILVRDDVLELLFRISITGNEFNIQW